MKLRLALLATAALAAPASANNCAAPTSRDNQLNLSGIVNTYYPVVATASGYSSTTKSFEIGPARSCAGCGQHALVPGDMVLVIQHQRMQINSTNTSSYGYGTGTGASAGSPGRGWTNASDTARFSFYRVVASSATLSGGQIEVAGGNNDGVDFTFGPAISGTNIRSTQVVHVPQYANVRLGGSLTAPSFSNASASSSGIPQYTGGVVVLDVAATLDFNGNTIDVSGKGFRGGGGRQRTGSTAGTTTSQVTSDDYVKSSALVSAHGSKGEGTVGTPRHVLEAGAVRDITDQGALFSAASDGYPGGSLGRGAPGNAGGGGTDNAPSPATTGNNQNTGGGGGAGYGDGGQGGQFGSVGNPGLGGVGLKTSLVEGTAQATNTIGGIWQYASFGGGGGAGSANDNANAVAASGAAGGGIVIIRAQAVTGTGQVLANGADASTGPSGDAAGGGGGGGWIVLAANQQVGVTQPSLVLQAKGGNGGSTSGAANSSGVGGGGGGGAIATTSNIGGVSAVVSGGFAGSSAGTSSSAANGESGLATTFGSIYFVGVGTSGAKGASSRSISSGAECVPFVTKSYTPALALSGTTRTFTVNITNPNGGTYPRTMGSLALTDTYPAGITNASTPNLTNNGAGNCGSMGGSVATSGVFSANGGSIPGGGTCTWTMNIVATGSTPLTNIIPQDSVSASIAAGTAGAVTTINETPAVATVTFPASATATKTSVVFSDPINGQTSPKRIPGALVDYTIGITNTVGGTLDNNSMVVSDALPSELKLFVGNLTGGAPYEFTANASNLTCVGCITYSTLASPNVNNDADWTYTPVPDADSADANVKHIRFKTSGAMANGSSISFRYRTVVK